MDFMVFLTGPFSTSMKVAGSVNDDETKTTKAESLESLCGWSATQNMEYTTRSEVYQLSGSW